MYLKFRSGETMDSSNLVVCISFCLLSLSCGGMQIEKEENADWNNFIEAKLNYSDVTVTDYVIGNISKETVTEVIVKMTTQRMKNTSVMNIGVERTHFALMPLAIGGIALLSGLVFIAIVNAKNIHEINVPENKLDVYIDSVTMNETMCEMISFTDSIDKNIEMVCETTWHKSITLDVNHKCFDVNFKLDTGAEVNILPLYILNMFKVKPKLSETNLSLTTYGNFKLKPDGSLKISCSTNKLINVPLPFYVVNVKSIPILGLKGCKELKLIERIDAIECRVISKNELIKQYKDVFTGIGEFPSEPYHITLKDNSVPVIHPPRRVPQALQPKLKSTLNNLEKEGIVSKVNKPTDWVQSLVIVKKPNGNLRLCLDPRDLNKVLKRQHYQISCTDDIISRLEGKKIFSVVDLKEGFWHVPLDEVSSEICTFNTPFGRSNSTNCHLE
ncbi:transposon Ty3-I Gag-Pol polyprotein [Nephila pilipes]|uniref:Transposon Ty3-I Gag-Pol polyprotein n=1 Tax=Nephila pilipes TaxID=299642 RepID=A0A8X6NFI3_NEPPI|nr:transposon Ty3-I Gag-Pol polyprotein [Nephila pilipes]